LRINRQRNIALGLIFGAFLIMYIGVFIKPLLPFLIVIGTLMILVSVFMYFRIGAMSMKIPTLECPHCHRYTKVLGVTDGCMHCRTPIRVELDEEGGLYAVENRA
jgi:hypothetical protein